MAAPSVVERILKEARGGLTVTELVLVKHLCLPNKILCERFKLTPSALKMRINRIAVKLGVENRTAIIVKSLKLGIVEIDQLVYRKFNGETDSP